MKKILDNKRIFTYKDIFRFIAITAAHYIAFSIYALIFLIAHYYTKGGSFFPNLQKETTLIIFCIFIAPAVNALIHVVYAELGSPWTRLAMWIFSFVAMIAIPAGILLI